MIKFILRILVVAIVSFFVAYFMVDRSLNYFFRPQIESVALRAVRGELHALHKELDAIAPADRARILHAEIAPLYGADIHLLPQEQVRLGDKERDQLTRLGVVFREDNGVYLFPLPGEPAQWLQVRQPGDSPADRLLAWSAWLLLSLIVATALFLLWALPIWRDLNVLRNATQLIGQGDLGTRVRLSRVAGIRHVGELQSDGRAHRRADREPAQPDQCRFARTAHAAGATGFRSRPAAAGPQRRAPRAYPAGHAGGHRRAGKHGGGTAGLRAAGTADGRHGAAGNRRRARLARRRAGAGRPSGAGARRALRGARRLPAAGPPAPPLHEPGAAQPGAERGALCQPPGACIPGRSRGRRLRTDRRR